MTTTRPRLRRAVGVVAPAALLVSLASCTGGDGGEDSNGTSDSTIAGEATTPPPPGKLGPSNGLERFTGQTLNWVDCGGDLECATVRVPLDYDDLSGPAVALSVNRVAAEDPDRRIGSLLVNPGGPGGSGTQYAVAMATLLGEDVRASYDVVGFDPRGVGDSDPLVCLNTDQLDAYIASDPDPDTPAEIADTMADLRMFRDACEQAAPKLLPHLSTVEVVRDLDILRAVLGDDELHYFGASYGTYIGAVYAELFPERVGRLVLDGAVDPSLDDAELNEQQAVGFETALRAYVEDCTSKEECPVGDDADAGMLRIRQLIDDLDAEPLPTDDPDRPLTEALGIRGLAFPLYVPTFWPGLSVALALALDGDGSGLLNMADLSSSRGEDGYADNSSQVIGAVNCLDHPSDSTVAEVESDVPSFEQQAPTFGRSFAWSQIACSQWPYASPPPPIDGAGAAPILVVGTTRDPATPLVWAEALADQLASGVLLTRDGDGHTAYGMGNDCIDDSIDAYLVDGTVPADGTAC